MELNICEGYCYQVVDSLLEVVTPATASILKELVLLQGAIEVSRDEALERGFEELANWSVPENDRLYVIGDSILICLPIDGSPYA